MYSRTSSLILCFLGIGLLVVGCSDSKTGTEPEPEPELQYGGISGYVYMVGTAQPISGVVVSCGGKTYTTLIDGTYELDHIPEGNQTLTATKSDYETYSMTVNVEADATRAHDIYMTSGVATSSLYGYVTHRLDGPIQGAEVKVEELIDYTDANGHYQLPNVPQGTQEITCTHEDYNPFSGSAYIASVDKQYDLFLTKTYEETILAAADAMVAYDTDYPAYPTDADSNYGDLDKMWLAQGNSQEQAAYAHVYLRQAAMPPHATPDNIQSATLTLFIPNYRIDFEDYVKVSVVLGGWDENTITWRNKPENMYSGITFWYRLYGLHPIDPPKHMDINVTNMYKSSDFDDFTGLVFSYDRRNQSPYYDNWVVGFYSSEYSNVERRPYFHIKYDY